MSPSRATLPGSSGSSSVRPPDGDPVKSSVEGLALERTPGGFTVSRTTAIPAFSAPCSGSWMYTMRHVIPAAKAEIAIGMKTAVLKATDQLTRSVRTAKISPKMVTSAGTIAIQMKLFLTAVRRTSLVKICS